MKWIFEQWKTMPRRLRTFILCFAALAIGLFLGLQTYSIVTTGEPLGINFSQFLGINQTN